MIARTCLNCNFALTEDASYCSNCGAPVLKKRLRTKDVLNELFDVIFLWNKTFIITVWALLIHPSRVFRLYLAGGRNKYMNPLFFLLLCYLLYQLYISIIHQQLFIIEGMKGSIEGFNEGYNKGSSVPEVDMSVLDKLNRYSKILFLLILPIIAFCSKVVFKSKQHNYAEHMSICSYLLGQIIIIVTLVSSVLLLFDINLKVRGIASTLIWIIYLVICQYQIFQNKVLKAILKSVIFLILSYILTGIPYSILGTILVSITK